MRRLWYLLIFFCLGLTALATLMVFSDNAQATTYWWDNGGADGKASTAANWNPDLPGPAGWTSVDNLTWGAVSVANCAFDSANTAYSWSILANYSGTITQGANDINIGAGGLSISAGGTGHFTGAGGTTYWVVSAGDCVDGGAHLTADVLRLKMTGNGKTLSVAYCTFKALWFSGATTWTETFGTSPTTLALTVDSGVTLSIASGKTCMVYCGSTVFGGYSNDGVINGPGTFRFWTYNAASSLVFGVINAPVSINSHAAQTADFVITVLATTSLGSTLTVESGSATETMTLDLNGKSLSASGLVTVGARGIIKSGVAGARIDAPSIVVQANGHIYEHYISGIIYSTPTASVKNPNLYSYTATSNLTVKTWSKDSGNATWLSVGSANGTVWGTPPTVGNASYYTISVKLLDFVNDPFWQNWTVWVYPPFAIISVAITLFDLDPGLDFEQFYVYNATATELVDDWNVTTNFTWYLDPSIICLIINDSTGQVRSIPVNASMIGIYWVNVTATNENGTAYQNYTLVAQFMEGLTTETVLVFVLALSLLALTTVMAFIDRRMTFVSGLTWFAASIFVFASYHIAFLMIGLAIAIVMFIEGAMHYVSA